jgi:hypothetical protein
MARSQLATFSDPLAYQAAVRATDVELLVKSKGEFEAELTRVDFSKLWMQRGSDNLPRIVRSTTRPITC